MTDPIVLDGSKFSGSGTLLRSALAFSSITSKSFVIEKILIDRKFPGLSAQKVALIESFAKATQADVAGNGVGSTILQFSPKLPFSGKKVDIDFSSPTSVTLPLQSLLIPSLISEDSVSINLTGGTHVANAPTIGFLRETLFRYLTPYFENISLNIPLMGFYPKGEGTVVCNLTSSISKGDKVRPLDVIEKDNLIALKGELVSSGEHLESDALKTINSLVSLSLKNYGVPLILQPQYVASKSSGVSMTLVALFGNKDGYDNSLPFIIGLDKTWSSLSTIDKSDLEDDCLSFVKEFSALISKKFVDIPSAELLLPFIAVLGGSIVVSEITERMNAIIYVSKEILDVDFIVVDNKISTVGYLNTLHESLPSIEDV
ncbi:hypothetical protein JXA48_03250 [Candidatus Woesearchaeota archaeon]|nr:hypothetical protein [Candidatus Woesearchaeota archaeon]